MAGLALSIKNYPQVTQEEFIDACQRFQSRYVTAEIGPGRRSWKCELVRSIISMDWFLSIRKPVPQDTALGWSDEEWESAMSFSSVEGSEHAKSAMEVDENDPETVQRYYPPNGHESAPWINYEIHYHQTYRVPCLWISLNNLPSTDEMQPLHLESLLRYAVPDVQKTMVRLLAARGTLLTISPNPVTSLPWFLIHPCNTTEALNQMKGYVTLDNYIQASVGVVGQHFGFFIPSAMAHAPPTRA